jgi:hypothetical protein
MSLLLIAFYYSIEVCKTIVILPIHSHLYNLTFISFYTIFTRNSLPTLNLNIILFLLCVVLITGLLISNKIRKTRKKQILLRL